MNIGELLTFHYIYVIVLIITVIGVLLSRKNPASVMAWIFVIMFLPVGGIIAYCLFGIDWRKKSLDKLDNNDRRTFFSNVMKLTKHDVTSIMKSEENETIKERTLKEDLHLVDDYKKLINMIGRTDNTYISYNKDCKFYYFGQEAFDDLKKDLLSATKTINMQYFIWKSDELGEEIKDILIKKAKEGVKIKLMFDGVGSIFKISRKYKKELSENGIEYKYFLDPVIKLMKLNYRNHRKMTLIDNKILHSGGMNLGMEYIDGGKRFDSWRDTNFRVEGEIALYYLGVFITDWLNSGGKYEEEIIPYEYNDPDNKMQLIASGPDSAWTGIKNVYNLMIDIAKEEVLIQSPYFVPDLALIESLKIISLSGVDVKVMLTGQPDKKVPYWVAETYFVELIEAGVEIYRYKKGFLHNKNIIIDGEVSTVGTCNFDIRSFDLNFEVNTVFYDKDLSLDLREQFFRDMEECEKVTMEFLDDKGLIKNLRDSILRILSPIL